MTLNMTYLSDWPRALPAVLAGAPSVRLQPARAGFGMVNMEPSGALTTYAH